MLKKEQKKRNKGKQNEKSKGRKKKNSIKPFSVVSAKTLYNFLTGKRYTQASEKPHLFL